MQIYGIILGIFTALLLLSGCSSKGTNVTYNGGAPNYGTMNNSAQSQKATMRPYQINGKWYYPTTVTLGESYDGIASWYGPKFHGKKTSNGETYSMHAHTAAHKTLPMNTIVRVTSKENGRSTIVRINDRGPFVAGRIIDLSKSAAQDIDMMGKGTARVRVEVIGFNGTISNSLPLNQETIANSEYKIATTQKTMQLSQFLVQIGAFRRKEGAQSYQQSNSEIHGYPAIIKEYMLDGAPIYRVMLSGFKSEAEARDFIALQKITGAFITTE
ncbi:septal ring lytic transglycosylase RlpA family protein [Helicobacter sp. MIT 11-5569]|uniref:septal ring lytic transglycosylase RlpA family protein n=1 Tax=Helicobacter sp. MIT 11-5569 TaxID=1548151 RepID=UPI000689FCDC|nr:septal ring lytic transglycosylase RlpA family protein [Helicobacter sp. MIT 11-5569]TLD84516.1 septal ring lytic transglycosylase RlpA family protein [Helicobacter sp. MIT 11-5569]